MNFVGEIIEKEVQAPEPLSFTKLPDSATPKKPSQWRSRLQLKGIKSMSGAVKETSDKAGYTKGQNGLNEFVDGSARKLNYEGLSEAERIHQENIELLSRMSVEERELEKQELIDSLDPAILEMLLKRGNKKGKDVVQPALDASGEWYGSSRDVDWGQPMDEKAVDKALGIDKEGAKPVVADVKPKPAKKQVSFAPSPELVDQLESQIASNISNIHFPKPPTPSEHVTDHVTLGADRALVPDEHLIDINDPDFNEKLHEKYFPDLPKDTENLKWMQPVPVEPVPEVVEDVRSLRFDFKGNLVAPADALDTPTYLGLHHHLEQPNLAGYTLLELAHLSRSSFNSQRCILVQTLGRILHKLGLNKFNMQTVDEAGEEVDADSEISDKLWDLVEELRILDTLQEFSDEKVERNLSVRNYCIELLWLWRQGGGKRGKSATKQLAGLEYQ